MESEALGLSKKEIRHRLLAIRRELSDKRRNDAKLALLEWMKEDQEFLSSEYVLLFASYGTELDLDPLIQYSLSIGKEVYLPRVQGEELWFYRIYDLEHFEISSKKIREPFMDAPSLEERLKQYVDLNLCPLVLVMPGLAFDVWNHRLGYGGGFYDRFLAKYPAFQEKTIGVGFREQGMDLLPIEDYDIKPNRVELF